MPEGIGIAVDTALVRELAELLDSNHLTEIEVKDGDRVIRVVRTAAAVTAVSGRGVGIVHNDGDHDLGPPIGQGSQRGGKPGPGWHHCARHR